ncbi:MipA/OmpV family protein [Marinobacter xestospongiae]|uniref:MipA/OmpV family protein n=1 Tax=Marinobacter xestospongiae TaxID=994319 RepID=A0ABU3VUN6_9GAMM|nr:MipA/OmpV family protein [Marinobacter xestospongiae]MDV2077983.1 MipA/OmpV family protein [Marinobacter xestospongiae]
MKPNHPLLSITTLVLALSLTLPEWARADDWNLEFGGGVLVMDPPWKGMPTQHQSLPYVRAEYGRWRLGVQYGLFQYRLTPAEWPVDVGIGLDYRDEVYESLFYSDDDLSDDPVFEGYDSPDGEGVARLDLRWQDLVVRLRQDVTDQSGGTSGEISYLHPVYQGAKGFQVRLGGGVVWKDREYSRYLYGIEGDNIDRSVGRYPYLPDDALNYVASMQVIYPFNQQWALSAHAHYEWLDETVSDSPLVGQDGLGRFMLFLTYRP